MPTKLVWCLLALMLTLLVASCDDTEQGSDPQGGATPAPSSDPADINGYLRQPGKITHVRYTTYTPPWPTRTDAWIDWDNDRMRSWNVQWTDSPTNPSICTSIRNRDEWYPCLPSAFKVEPQHMARVSTIYPDIPIRASDTELSLPFPRGFFAENVEASRVQIDPTVTTSDTSQADAKLVVRTQRITSTPDLPCGQEEGTGSASFEYTSTDQGEAISEFITLTCGTESQPIFGVLYHEVEFFDAADLPDDFFDVNATRKSLNEDQLSSAAAQLGSVFWLGDAVGEWKLEGASHESDSASVYYSRGDGDGQEVVELITRVGSGRQNCMEPEPLSSNAYGGMLCARDESNQGYTVAFWTPPGVGVWLEADSYESNVSQDDARALALRLEQWEDKADGPLLSEDAVINLIADSLELVCPSKRAEIRATRSEASFDFDRTTGEWTGVFGDFGEIAVPDSKPVAIPVNNREEVESTLSHNAAQFADCVEDEGPPPQEGDDEFAVKFIGNDDSGFDFEVTGIDPETEAALTFCIFDDARCVLTDPGGATVGIRGAEANDVRSGVVRIHIPLDEEELSREGQWKLRLDLGEGRMTEVTFELR